MEPKLYKKLKRATLGFHWQRHEDKFSRGIPDCSFGSSGVCGWVELKTYDSWPRNSDTPLRFTDLKPEQVNWMMARGSSSGRCWWLVSVSDDWFLIGWEYSRDLGSMTRSELLSAADIWGSGPIPAKLSQILVNDGP